MLGKKDSKGAGGEGICSPVSEGGSVCKDVSHSQFCPITLGEVRVKENHDLFTEWEINPPLPKPQGSLSHVKTVQVCQPGEHTNQNDCRTKQALSTQNPL